MVDIKIIFGVFFQLLDLPEVIFYLHPLLSVVDKQQPNKYQRGSCNGNNDVIDHFNSVVAAK